MLVHRPTAIKDLDLYLNSQSCIVLADLDLDLDLKLVSK